MKTKTLVLGASDNPSRYSYLAVQRLSSHHKDVIAVGRKEGVIGNHSIVTGKPQSEEVDTITLYLNPDNQKPYYDYILSLQPRRIIFNPGTENEELKQLAREQKIETVYACTLVMLATGQY